MSNPLANKINEIVSSQIKASRTTMMTQIVTSDREAGVISVKPVGASFAGMVTEDGMTEGLIENITVLNYEAFKDAAPELGDYAYIDFVNGNMSNAVLLNIIKPSSPQTYETGRDETPPAYTYSNILGGGRQLE